jgi:hypothetical protein
MGGKQSSLISNGNLAFKQADDHRRTFSEETLFAWLTSTPLISLFRILVWQLLTLATSCWRIAIWLIARARHGNGMAGSFARFRETRDVCVLQSLRPTRAFPASQLLPFSPNVLVPPTLASVLRQRRRTLAPNNWSDDPADGDVCLRRGRRAPAPRDVPTAHARRSGRRRAGSWALLASSLPPPWWPGRDAVARGCFTPGGRSGHAGARAPLAGRRPGCKSNTSVSVSFHRESISVPSAARVSDYFLLNTFFYKVCWTLWSHCLASRARSFCVSMEFSDLSYRQHVSSDSGHSLHALCLKSEHQTGRGGTCAGLFGTLPFSNTVALCLCSFLIEQVCLCDFCEQLRKCHFVTWKEFVRSRLVAFSFCLFLGIVYPVTICLLWRTQQILYGSIYNT